MIQRSLSSTCINGVNFHESKTWLQLLISKIFLRMYLILKASNGSVWSNGFWYVKVYIFWKFVQYTIHWDKTQMSKKFPLDKINVTKNTLFFLSRAPTYHNFTFNPQFLYNLKHNVHLSKSVCRIFYFWFHLVFIKVYIIVR